MSISAFIPELLLHHNEQVKAWALLANDIRQGLDDQSLSKEQYVELMSELERLKRVITVADDLFTYATMARIVDGLVTVAKAMKFI